MALQALAEDGHATPVSHRYSPLDGVSPYDLLQGMVRCYECLRIKQHAPLP